MSISEVDIVEKLVVNGLATREFLFHYAGCDKCFLLLSDHDAQIFVECNEWWENHRPKPKPRNEPLGPMEKLLKEVYLPLSEHQLRKDVYLLRHFTKDTERESGD